MFGGDASCSVDEVLPGLYLGDEATSRSREVLAGLGVTHVVIAADECSAAFPDAFAYHRVEGMDSSGTDLIPYFNECNSFIDSALENAGKVLVHCAYGVSRSATLVIAYVMFKTQMKYGESLNFVRGKRRQISPSDWLREQLKHFHSTLSSPEEVYRCRHCRMQLFISSDLVPHTSTSSKKFKKRQRDQEVSAYCSSFFTEQLPWMRDLEEMEGRLLCPKCGMKVGDFNWTGKQCSCGYFISPGFQIIKSNVDIALDEAMPTRVSQPRHLPA